MIFALPLLAAADAGLVGWAATRLDVSAGPANAAHVALTVAALWVCVTAAAGRANRRFDPFDLVIGSAFGPCGIAAMAVANRIRWRVPRASTPVGIQLHPDTGTVGPADINVVHRVLEDRIAFPEADQVESLAVTLRFGEQAARQKALQTVVRSFEPRLSPLIALALSDKDQAIRALAAAASAQISNDIALAVAEMDTKLAAGVELAELLPLVLRIAGHGCHDVLLPRTQQLALCRASASYLAAHLPQAGSREQGKAMRVALTEIEEVLALAEAGQPGAAADPSLLCESV